MSHLQETLAYNLKRKRRKCGFTQAQLAERVNVSTHHIAMIEIARNYPTLELTERIADALDIETYELFVEKGYSPSKKLEKELEQLRKEIRSDMQQLFADFQASKNPG